VNGVNTFTFARLSKVHLPQALTLLDDAMGAGYVSASRLAELGATCAMDQHGDIVGVCIADVVADNGAVWAILSGAKPADADLIRELVTFPAGLLRTIAVRSDSRRQGIGGHLLASVEQSWRSEGVISMLALGWKRSDTNEIPVAGLLEAHGLWRATEIVNYWLDDSVKRGYSCPADGSPCHCTAVVFVRAVEGELSSI
jgi:GNAT superfamily N-acetyltransferase